MEFLAALAVLAVVVWAITKAVSSSRESFTMDDDDFDEHQFPTTSASQRRSKQTYVDEPDSESGKMSFEVGNRFFFGSESPDGRYLTGASDMSGTRGACVLLNRNSGEVLFKIGIKRPNNPHVSNEGMVVVEDWKGDDLAGALICIDRTGSRQWTKNFKANVFDSGLSADGTRGFVSTANSDYEGHSGKTFFIDTATGEVLWKFDGWQDIRFDRNTLVVEVEIDEGRKTVFPFDNHGQLPTDYFDTLQRAEEQRCAGRCWWALPRVEEALKASPPRTDDAQRYLDGITETRSEMSVPTQAKILRYKGEVLAAKGNEKGAVRQWQKAMELDPKVGIKRRLDAILSGKGDPGQAARPKKKRTSSPSSSSATSQSASHPVGRGGKQEGGKTNSRVPVPAMDAFDPVFEPIGSTEAICPYCRVELEKKLVRKKACPSCRQMIRVKTRPGDRKQVMVTEDQLPQIETQWNLYQYFKGMTSEDRKEYNDERDRLRSQFGRMPGHFDVRWSLYNRELIEHTSAGDMGFYASTKGRMAALLEEEGRLKNALDGWLEAAGLDLNGATNTSSHRDDPELMAEYPQFQPSMSFLAPGIASHVEWIREKLGLSEDDIRRRFLDVYQKRLAGLKVPLTSEEAWNRFLEAAAEE